MSVVAIIPARGGSRGIPRKNLLPVCGKPLLAWSVEHALEAASIDSVFVSSDSDEILELAQQLGAQPIRRPADISGDTAASEATWLHALDVIEAAGRNVELIVGMQATSPIRESSDLDRAIAQFRHEHLDALLSVCEVQDFFMWRAAGQGRAVATNYDPAHRKPRQQIEPRYLENGSFYLFSPALLRRTGCRLGGRIGMFVMAKHKLFQIDEPADVPLCEAILRGYGMAPVLIAAGESNA